MKREIEYRVTIGRNGDGSQEYIQILSKKQPGENIVIVGKFKLVDTRTGKDNR